MAYMLTVDGAHRMLIPVGEFRQDHALPEGFGVAEFEPKDTRGLGRLDHAGSALVRLRNEVIGAVPSVLTAPDLMPLAGLLADDFRARLWAVNEAIGLREPEVAFAVEGFHSVVRTYCEARFKAQLLSGTANFEALYNRWLQETVNVAARAYSYTHHGATWTIHIIHHAYGRIGLRVTMPGHTAYIHDATLACPAENYMSGLLRAVAAQIDDGLRT